jgi:hypothetical protein
MLENELGDTKMKAIEKATQLCVALTVCAGCSSHSNDAPGGTNYALGSVVIDADGNRTTYVQTIDSTAAGPFDNATAIELPGNGVLMGGNKSFYVGLAEEPTWVRYAVDASGKVDEVGRISFLNFGADAIDYGNAIVDAETAVSVLSKPAVAVVWNPTTLKIKGQIDLSSLRREGYELEVWTTVAHDGLVYVPARWSDWDGGRIYPGVSTTIIDPKALTVLGTATDDRCASGGRVVFDAAGYAYVMGDGRNYSIQMFANASGETAPENCLLRIAPGATEFEASYFYRIPALTGGLESIGELEAATQGSGFAFSKMFYPDELPDGVKPVDFAFWSEPAHKMWRLELGVPPTAKEVDGVPFAAIGFSGSALDGKLYSGESSDGQSSVVYELDPATNSAKLSFKMDGYFDGLYELAK